MWPSAHIVIDFLFMLYLDCSFNFIFIREDKRIVLSILRFIRNARWDIMNIIRRILIENVSFLSDIVLNHYERGRRRQNFHNKAFQLFILQKNKDDAR